MWDPAAGLSLAAADGLASFVDTMKSQMPNVPLMTTSLTELGEDDGVDDDDEGEEDEVEHQEEVIPFSSNMLGSGERPLSFMMNPLARISMPRGGFSAPSEAARGSVSSLGDVPEGAAAGHRSETRASFARSDTADIENLSEEEAEDVEEYVEDAEPPAPPPPSACRQHDRAADAAETKETMGRLLGAIQETGSDFIARLEEQESKRASSGGEGATRAAAVVSFKATVKKSFGRATRGLEVDLEARTVTQVHGKEKKLMHCHKFLTMTESEANNCELQCAIKSDEKAEKLKVWRFSEHAELARFRNLVAMLNTSGITLLEIFSGMDRKKQGLVTVLDLAYALQDAHLPVDEKEVRTMIMIARSLATVASKSSAGTATGGGSSSGWNAPGGAGQIGLTLDYATFFDLFASGGQPVHTLRECLEQWQAKYKAVDTGAGAQGGVQKLAEKIQHQVLCLSLRRSVYLHRRNRTQDHSPESPPESPSPIAASNHRANHRLAFRSSSRRCWAARWRWACCRVRPWSPR